MSHFINFPYQSSSVLYEFSIDVAIITNPILLSIFYDYLGIQIDYSDLTSEITASISTNKSFLHISF